MNPMLINSYKYNGIKLMNTLTIDSYFKKILINQFHNANSNKEIPSTTPNTLNLNINNSNLKVGKLSNDIKNLDILINPQQQANIKTPQLDVKVNLDVIKHKKPGIIFDIDGVLVKGKNVLPETLKTLKLLHTLHIPFMFLTNGGGKTEKKKAQELSQRFQIPIHEEQVVLGHSPMRTIPDEIKNKIVLVIGPGILLLLLLYIILYYIILYYFLFIYY